MSNGTTAHPSSSPETDALDLRSHDITGDKIADLTRLFPEIRTEGGKIDIERLKLALGEAVDVGKERYGMNWPGKRECFKTIQAPSLGTLRPCPEESVNFDTTDNLIIEGDNLEVLKLLQKAYLGKIKMIYIDPPYNTGNDFIYPDNYTESLETYLEYTGQADAEGKKFGTNTEADGRFHSKWLNMMYPRLYLARNLLRDDGLVFISIDDHELDNLRKLCAEVFGEENFIEGFVWKKSYGGGAKERFAVRQHEFCILYAKNIDALNEFWLPPDPEAEEKYYDGKDEHLEKRGPYRIKPLEATKSMDRRENLMFPITAPDGTQVLPKRQWWWSKDRVEATIAENGLVFTKTDNGWSISYKQYLIGKDGQKRGAKPFSIIDGIYTQHGTADLRALFDDEVVLQFPKPVALIERFLQIDGDKNALVIDFFAGSGTTAHAVFQANEADGGSRRFILVQLPEPTERTDCPTIADICKERVRRVNKRLNDADAGKFDMDNGLKPDRGFRVFKLDQSNLTTWDAGIKHDPATLERQLELHVDHIRDGRTSHDILYELLLKSGFPLTTPVEKVALAGKSAYSVAGGALVICLEPELTLDLIRAIAEKKPERIVCLDGGFAGNDQLKANAVQIFKTKGVTSFKTV
ncbi:MAG: site-specific DNA-methyltransferase [Pirellulales bacterium]|nr:site-specific DNA-methyltransferase [Pirellulales bacterium]